MILQALGMVFIQAPVHIPDPGGLMQMRVATRAEILTCNFTCKSFGCLLSCGAERLSSFSEFILNCAKQRRDALFLADNVSDSH